MGITKYVCVLLFAFSAVPATAQERFREDFERDLARWHLVVPQQFRIVDSGHAGHGKVLVMTPNGSHVYALIRGSERWGGVRVEGDVLFPSDTDNYFGIVYNYRETGGRAEYSNIYIKGNDSYIRVNPRLDGNPLRSIYEEYQAALTGESAIRTGQWQHFKAEIIGTMCHFYVGDMRTPKVTFDFPYLTNGPLGFEPRVVGSEVWIDNIQVSSIHRFQNTGLPIPSIRYQPEQLVTNWQALGPFAGAIAEIEAAGKPTDRTYREFARTYRWRPFETDRRGAVVTARLVDFTGPRHRAYLYANLRAERKEDVTLLFSTVNELFVWLNGEFLGYVYKEDFAWHDFWNNEQHRSKRSLRDVTLEPGDNHLLILVNGGNYAGGGFFLQRRPNTPK